MAKPPKTQKLTIDGPVGDLEALLDMPPDPSPTAAVVVCHPHPQHGGTMHNKVAHTLARSFVGLDFAALRFNFRGTESSAGSYDEGQGELDDALAALEWMRQQYPGLPLWLAGFSFGAAIAVRAAVAVSVDGQPQCPWLVVQGDADELVAVDETIEWVNGLEPGPELLVLPDVEHFFHGNLVVLREAVAEFVARHSA